MWRQLAFVSVTVLSVTDILLRCLSRAIGKHLQTHGGGEATDLGQQMTHGNVRRGDRDQPRGTTAGSAGLAHRAAIFPASTSCMIASAVNDFVVEPRRNGVCGVTALPVESAAPKP